MPHDSTQISSAQGSAAPAPHAFVEVEDLAKTYGAIRALRGVSVQFRAGEVHGLVGANGAGKSTLVRALAGLEQPDGGVIRIDGRTTTIASSTVASKLGLAFIHQELNLVADFTASQNIMLGSHTGPLLSPRRVEGVHPRAKEVAARIGIDFALDRPVSRLTVHQQWLVSIARALVHDCRLIAMDEPTASLDANESRRLLDVARDLAAHGVAVLFISHRLDEVLDVCDRVTAFRDGQVASSMDRSAMTREGLIDAIVGREVSSPGGHRSTADIDRPVALEVAGIRRGRVVNGASLELREGELLGVAGLVGSGRTELARIIFGADRADSGTMHLYGQPYRPRSIADAIRRGIGFVSEERRAEALFLDLSVTSNLYASTWRRRRSRFTRLINERRAQKNAAATASDLGVVLRSGGVTQSIGGLSGGNQQKVVLGRWLETGPRILLLDEPTRGVDIGARSEIYRQIREIARGGMAVMVISSDLEELLECDRVVVMRAGATVGELGNSSISVNEMLRLCYNGPTEETQS